MSFAKPYIYQKNYTRIWAFQLIEILMNYIDGELPKINFQEGGLKSATDSKCVFSSLPWGREEEENSSKPASQFAFTSLNWKLAFCVRSYVLLLLRFFYFVCLRFIYRFWLLFFLSIAILGATCEDHFMSPLAGFIIHLIPGGGGRIVACGEERGRLQWVIVFCLLYSIVSDWSSLWS